MSPSRTEAAVCGLSLWMEGGALEVEPITFCVLGGQIIEDLAFRGSKPTSYPVHGSGNGRRVRGWGARCSVY